MTKLEQYLQEVQQEFRDHFPNGPRLTVKCKGALPGESFQARYAAGEVTLVAQDHHAAIFGVGLIAAGVQSGHLGDYLDQRRPKFPLRPLWFHRVEDPEATCRRTLALGYNAVVLDSPEGEWNGDWGAFREYGVKLILKPEWSSFQEKSFLETATGDEITSRLRVLQRAAPEVDGVLWEGTFFREASDRHPSARDLLPLDLALREVCFLEKTLLEGRFLVFYIPYVGQEQAAWLPDFCDGVGPGTRVAFSAVCGDPTEDHLAPHPFWEVLRQRLDPCYTPLMPIFNVGAVKQGEALWPALALDIMSDIGARCRRHKFEGVISPVPRLPKPGSLLFGNLWMASHVAWGDTSPDLLAQTWLAAFRPEFDSSALGDIRQAAVELGRLRYLSQNKGELSSESSRVIGEALLARLKQMELGLDTGDDLFRDYFVLFAQDARRIIRNFFQTYHVSSGNFFAEKGDEESFWTSPSEGMGPSTPFVVHEQPLKGAPGTLLRRLADTEC